MDRKLLLYAFAVSGMAALIYEIVWSRTLQLVFGSTIYAASTIITTFLVGASFGAFLFRNIVEKKNSLRLFAILEAGIGIYGLLSIYLFRGITNFVVSIDSPIASFLVLFVVLIIPTTLFGATWPIIGKAYINKEQIGKDSGILYSWNSLGSFLGPILTGFALIPLLGITATTIIAAILNLLIAGIFFIQKWGENGD